MERGDNGLMMGVMVGHECTEHGTGSVNSRV